VFLISFVTRYYYYYFVFIMADPVSRFPYVPSQPLAGVTAGLFAASFLLTLFQIIRKRAWVWLVMLLSILSKYTATSISC
jgi:hypothetical protein